LSKVLVKLESPRSSSDWPGGRLDPALPVPKRRMSFMTNMADYMYYVKVNEDSP
jgi:hypothetical protein